MRNASQEILYQLHKYGYLLSGILACSPIERVASSQNGIDLFSVVSDESLYARDEFERVSRILGKGWEI